MQTMWNLWDTRWCRKTLSEFRVSYSKWIEAGKPKGGPLWSEVGRAAHSAEIVLNKLGIQVDRLGGFTRLVKAGTHEEVESKVAAAEWALSGVEARLAPLAVLVPSPGTRRRQVEPQSADDQPREDPPAEEAQADGPAEVDAGPLSVEGAQVDGGAKPEERGRWSRWRPDTKDVTKGVLVTLIGAAILALVERL